MNKNIYYHIIIYDGFNVFGPPKQNSCYATAWSYSLSLNNQISLIIAFRLNTFSPDSPPIGSNSVHQMSTRNHSRSSPRHMQSHPGGIFTTRQWMGNRCHGVEFHWHPHHHFHLWSVYKIQRNTRC